MVCVEDWTAFNEAEYIMKGLPSECVHKAFLSGIGSQVKMAEIFEMASEIFSTSRLESRSNGSTPSNGFDEKSVQEAEV
jgi:hypothetical protein